MKLNVMVQATLVAFCLGLAGLPLLLAQIPPAAQHRAPLSKKPTIVPEAQLRLQHQKYWTEQRKDFKALTNDSWAYEEWTGDDAPYAAVRAQVERVFLRGTQPQAIAAKYETAAKAEPNNSLAQFGWAYAVRQAVRSDASLKSPDSLRYAAELALAEAPAPHTYNYDRLRYLIWIQGGGGAPSHFLKAMAYRLLARDPHDFPVLLGLAAIYTQNRDKEAQRKGYALIQQMTRNYPNKPEVYDMLGCWYYTQYMFYRDPRNYRLAMSTYQKALGLYPASSARREGLPQVMAFLTTRFHQISAGGP